MLRRALAALLNAITRRITMTGPSLILGTIRVGLELLVVYGLCYGREYIAVGVNLFTEGKLREAVPYFGYVFLGLVMVDWTMERVLHYAKEHVSAESITRRIEALWGWHKTTISSSINKSIRDMLTQEEITIEHAFNFHELKDVLGEPVKIDIVEKCLGEGDSAYVSGGRVWLMGHYAEYIGVLRKLCESLPGNCSAKWLCLYTPYEFYDSARETPIHIAALNVADMVQKERIMIFESKDQVLLSLQHKNAYDRWKRENNKVACAYVMRSYVEQSKHREICDLDFALFNGNFLLKFREFAGDRQYRGLAEICLAEVEGRRHSVLFDDVRGFASDKYRPGGNHFWATIERLALALKNDIPKNQWDDEWQPALSSYGTDEAIVNAEIKAWTEWTAP